MRRKFYKVFERFFYLCSDNCDLPFKLIPFLINLLVDLFAKASDGRSSGDSPCAKGVVIGDADSSLIDAETEFEPLCDTAAPTVTVHDLTEINADEKSDIITDSSADICNTSIIESAAATSTSESLCGSVTPAPNVVSKAPTKRARASKVKAAPAPTKRQKAMASSASAIASASASVSVALPMACDADELQQDGETVAMEVTTSSDTGEEQPTEVSSVSAAITEESASETCHEEPKAAVVDAGLKKRKRTPTIAAKTPKKEEVVLSAEVLKKIECITGRISSNLGELAALER